MLMLKRFVYLQVLTVQIFVYLQMLTVHIFVYLKVLAVHIFVYLQVLTAQKFVYLQVLTIQRFVYLQVLTVYRRHRVCLRRKITLTDRRRSPLGLFLQSSPSHSGTRPYSSSSPRFVSQDHRLPSSGNRQNAFNDY